MLSSQDYYECVDNMINKGKRNGILHLNASSSNSNYPAFNLDDTELVNFGSCSYLSLEKHPDLIQGAIEAVKKYGTQFSSSRAYVSIDLYLELENLFKEIFKAYPIICPTTSLAHLAALPVLVGEKDVVLLDHQVHSSVQTAAKLLMQRKTKVELIRHNSIDSIKEKIKEYSSKFNKIWYFADGIYSMYGDYAPLQELHTLMDQYPQFYTYIDDAHGMSCYGEQGCGFVLSKYPIREQMVVSVSLAKAFGSGGAAVLFKNSEIAQKIRNVGGPMITSGPIQPAVLGANVACAKLHLSTQISLYQQELQQNIDYAMLLIKQMGLPLIKSEPSPIFFIGVSNPDVAMDMIEGMMNRGFYTNLSVFPVVPMKNAGVRFTITRTHTKHQIERFIQILAQQFHASITKYGVTIDKICKAFRLSIPENYFFNEPIAEQDPTDSYIIEHIDSIRHIKATEWNHCFKGRGNYDYEGMCIIEEAMTSSEIEWYNQWKFDYFIIRNRNNQIIGATFLSTALVKDDMMCDAELSTAIEDLRSHNPWLYTSSQTMMGCMITEGDHLYISEEIPDKSVLLNIFKKEIEKVAETRNATSILIRDIDANLHNSLNNCEFSHYVSVKLPLNFEMNLQKWNNMGEYLDTLSYKSRRHLKRNILPDMDKYEIITDKAAIPIDIAYQLYLNVVHKSKKLNTFPFSKLFFEKVHLSNNWKILALRSIETGQIEGISWNYCSGRDFNLMLVGLNYNQLCYRQTILATILYAKKMQCALMRLGFTADIEKLRFGAEATQKYVFFHSTETFNYEAMTYHQSKLVANI